MEVFVRNNQRTKTGSKEKVRKKRETEQEKEAAELRVRGFRKTQMK
jgi:hypothetical protein